MTFAHTPGPWIAKPLTYNWSIESEQGHPVARIPLNDVTYFDLRLMNAAPDLLAALQLIVDRATRPVPDLCGQPMVSVRLALIEQARAAIAKAGGAA